MFHWPAAYQVQGFATPLRYDVEKDEHTDPTNVELADSG
jgi:hypothetical protein